MKLYFILALFLCFGSFPLLNEAAKKVGPHGHMRSCFQCAYGDPVLMKQTLLEIKGKEQLLGTNCLKGIVSGPILCEGSCITVRAYTLTSRQKKLSFLIHECSDNLLQSSHDLPANMTTAIVNQEGTTVVIRNGFMINFDFSLWSDTTLFKFLRRLQETDPHNPQKQPSSFLLTLLVYGFITACLICVYSYVKYKRTKAPFKLARTENGDQIVDNSVAGEEWIQMNLLSHVNDDDPRESMTMSRGMP